MVSGEDEEDEELGELMQLLGASTEALRGVAGGEGTAGDGGAGVGYRAAEATDGARQGGAAEGRVPGGEGGAVPGAVGGDGSGWEMAGVQPAEPGQQQQQGLLFGDFSCGVDAVPGRVTVPVPVPVPVPVAAHGDGHGDAGTAVGGVGMAAGRVGRVGLAAVRAFGDLLLGGQQGAATGPGAALHWGEASPGGGGGGRGGAGAGGGGGGSIGAAGEGSPGQSFTPRRPSEGGVYGEPYGFDPQYGMEGAARLEWVGTGGRNWRLTGVAWGAVVLERLGAPASWVAYVCTSFLLKA